MVIAKCTLVIGVHAITLSWRQFVVVPKKASGWSHFVQYRTPGASPGNPQVHRERGEFLRLARCRFEDPTHFLPTAPDKAAAK
jgi:hypothetical protein